jgi:hypothetical protein
MKGAKAGAWAGAVLAFFPLAAAAQSVEVGWRPTPAPIPEAPRFPAYYRAGEPMPETSPDTIPFRPPLDFEDSAEDREHRLAELSKCGLLAEVRGFTVLDVIAGIPNDMIDLVTAGFQPRADRDCAYSYRSSEDCSLIPRLFSGVRDGSDHPFDDLMGQLLVREQKYFARFQDSDLATTGVENGSEDIDTDELMDDQRKIWFDAARKLYFGRFGRNADDRFREEAIDITRWHAIDFVVAPTLVAGYLYIRGWEKKVDVFGLKCAFQMEPLRRILERFEGSRDDLVAAASVEVGVGSFPVKVIVSVGIQDGDALLDFVGIGTSIGKAKQCVSQELDGLKRDAIGE